MSDLMPVTPSAGPPALPYRPGDRSQFLAQLLADLATATLADGQPFGLRTLALSDPTVALLDAWATVADVIAFYQERIATEGFLRTATQPGSLLSIAQLTGYRPRPGLAASVWLAYSLKPDPTDTAVVLPAGLLAQSVPGTGELPQTFETTTELVARPSWSTLPVRTTGPVIVPAGGAGDLTALAFQGVTTGLSANTMILLGLGADTPPAHVLVNAVTVDKTRQITSVSLQVPQAARAVAQTPSALAAPASYGNETKPITSALDALLPGLRKQPAPPPSSAAALNRSPGEVFQPNSDALPRLVAALDPALSATLYKALGSTAIGPAQVTAAQALRVQATPFGVRMPPRPVFSIRGQQVGSEEYPIGDVQTLGVELTWGVGAAEVAGGAQVSVSGPAGASGQADVALTGLPVTTTVGGLGSVTVSRTATAGGAGGAQEQPVRTGAPLTSVTFSFAATQPGPLRNMTLTVAAGVGTSITLTFDDGSEVVWVPGSPVDRFSVGNQIVTVAGPDPNGLLAVSVAEALPVADPTVLDLDTTYPGIVPLSWVVIEAAGADPGSVSYPLVVQVTNVATVAVARYGMSGTVTELTLAGKWVDEDARWLSAIRPLSVRAQTADLTLLPVALPGPLSGSTIELDGLYPGIEAGHVILVTGTRTDLPGGVGIAAGEAAMVAGVTQQTDAITGDTPHTTLQLAAPALTYTYELGSVKVYGNVVPAHQGATVTEPLAAMAPGDLHPSFTLSKAPVLADPSATAAGSVSSVKLTVGGRTWTPVTRLDADTPAESYLTGIDGQGRTTIELSGPLPTGTSSVVASYRAGQGSAGNVRAHQVTQLLSRPLAVAGVDNPLPGSGGSDGDGPGDLRAGASIGLACLGRLVSVTDTADLVRSWAGVGKATAVSGTDSHGEVVVVTVAGVAPVALDPSDALIADLAGALVAAGGPGTSVVVRPATLYLIVLAARVRRDPAYAWADVSAALRSALFAGFGYPRRQIGQDIVLSDITAIAHSVAGVVSFCVTAITLIPTTATASEIEATTATLPAPPSSGCVTLPVAAQADGGPTAGAVAFLSAAAPDTLILQQEVNLWPTTGSTASCPPSTGSATRRWAARCEPCSA